MASRLRLLVEEIPDERAIHFNDVFADTRVRVSYGNMPIRERPGRLYRLDYDGSLHRLLDGIRCSNGMGLTLDRRRLYYTGSETCTIYLFDHHGETGE